MTTDTLHAAQLGYASRMKLPPGPRMPTFLQGMGWWNRPTAFMERCRARYGKRFTIRLPRGDVRRTVVTVDGRRVGVRRRAGPHTPVGDQGRYGPRGGRGGSGETRGSGRRVVKQRV